MSSSSYMHNPLIHRDRRLGRSESDWVRSFDCEDMTVLIVCRGPIRREALDVFEEMGMTRAGILLSEKDSIVYPRALAPELRRLDPSRVHSVSDYTGASKEGRAERIRQIIEIAKVNGYDYVFAGYGFNRSHSAGYALVAFQTGYLKAHYPAEYMAAVLTHNLSDIKKITFFIDECRRQNIQVLGPDINESDLNFMVNEKGEIRFGLAAIKNVGESAAMSIIQEREENGHYQTIFDLAKRINLRSVNKRSFEALAMAGAFDGFENTHRAQFFYRENTEDSIFLEKILKHAADYQQQQNSSQVSLFGDAEEIEIKDPEMPVCDPWTKLEQLKNEKEVTGFYMSGHPLEDFKMEMDNFCNITINEIKNNLGRYKNRNITFAGIVTAVNNRTSKTGNQFATFVMEDFTDYFQFILFSEDYLKLKHFLIEGTSLLVKAKVISRNNNYRDQLDVKINDITLLSEALEKLTNEIILKVSLNALNEDMVDKFTELTKKEHGKCHLKFQVSDEENNVSVELPSQKITVNPISFLKHITEIEEISFKLVN